MKTLLLSFAILAAFAVSAAPAERPSFDEVKSRIRKDHPRLFLTREAIPDIRKLLGLIGLGVAVGQVGWGFFSATGKGFADVL